MKIKWKKLIICFIISMLFISTLVVNAQTSNNDENESTLYTENTTTYFNGVKIDSYNINGRTAIFVDDLQKLGYVIKLDKEKNEITISSPDFQYNKTPEIDGNKQQVEKNNSSSIDKNFIIIEENGMYRYKDIKNDTQTILLTKVWPFIGDYGFYMTEDLVIHAIDKNFYCVWNSNDLVQIADSIINTDVVNMSGSDFDALLNSIVSPEVDTDLEVYYKWLDYVEQNYIDELYEYNESEGQIFCDYFIKSVQNSAEIYNNKLESDSRRIDSQILLMKMKHEMDMHHITNYGIY